MVFVSLETMSIIKILVEEAKCTAFRRLQEQNP